MTTQTLTLIALGLLALAPLACQEDLGPNPYGNQENFLDDDEADEFLEGPSPYDGSSPRLSLGVFYEGGASETLPVDGVSRHYYIYQNEFAGNIDTYSQEPSTDRLEGFSADRIVHSGNPWWGGGIHWDSPRNMTSWGTMHISLKSADPSFDALKLAMESVDGGVGLIDVADYGFVADDTWHTLAIPLTDFSGINRNAISIVLRFDGAPGDAGETLLVDNLYFTR